MLKTWDLIGTDFVMKMLVSAMYGSLSENGDPMDLIDNSPLSLLVESPALLLVESLSGLMQPSIELGIIIIDKRTLRGHKNLRQYGVKDIV
jgi:hypothetical protein